METLHDWEREDKMDGTEKLNDAAQDAPILLVEDRGAVRCLTMNRPKALNALSDDMLAALQALPLLHLY